MTPNIKLSDCCGYGLTFKMGGIICSKCFRICFPPGSPEFNNYLTVSIDEKN